MVKYHYKVVPVPERCVKPVDGDSRSDRVAATLEQAMNALAAEGWEFIRTEQATMQDRGLLRRRELTRDMLVFRREPVAAPRQAPGAPVTASDDGEVDAMIRKVHVRRVKRAPDATEPANSRPRINFIASNTPETDTKTANA